MGIRVSGPSSMGRLGFRSIPQAVGCAALLRTIDLRRYAAKPHTLPPEVPPAGAQRSCTPYRKLPSEVFRLLSFAKLMTKSQAMGS